MSLILAFGLSPLGQVPAYADDSPSVVATQAEGAAVYQFSGIYYTYGGEVNPTLTYNGGSQELTIRVLNGDEAAIGDNGATGTAEECFKYKWVAPGQKESQVEAKPPKAGVITESVTKKGTYKLVVTGTDADIASDTGHSYAAATPKTFEIEVGQFDISDLMFVADVEGTMHYKASDQSVGFRLAKVADGASDDEKAAILAANYVEGTKLAEATDDKLKVAFQAGDIDATPKVVTDAGRYPAAISAVGGEDGNCTGSVDTTLVVDKVNFLKGPGTAKITGASSDVEITVDDETGNGTVAKLDISLDKAQDPIQLKYVDEDDKEAKLKEKTDYTVKYFETDGKTAITGALPTTVDYIAKITMSSGSPNFQYKYAGQSASQTIEVTCHPSNQGTIENGIAVRAELPDAVFLGSDNPVKISTEGARFFDKDGKDVTDIVGTGTKLTVNDETGDPDVTYAIAATNTANTAKLVGKDYGSPDSSALGIAGAGEYTVNGVTGDGTSFQAGDGVPATIKVLPRASKEGDDIGDLKVEVKPLAYDGGKYIDMTNQYSVQMYTAKGAGLVKVDENSGDKNGQMGEKVVNYTVTYYKDGKKVTGPTEMGTYEAVFKFSGNLEGTPDITKEFTVDSGDIATKVFGVKDKKVKAKDGEGNTIYEADPSLVFTGKALELNKKNLVLVGEDGQEVAADDLVGTDYELTYERGSVAPGEDGKPLNAGAYILKATFSGKYTGTIEGTLDVLPLQLTYATALNKNAEKDGDDAYNSVAELQFQQADGSWDVDYSALKTGEAINPTVRVAIKDGNERTDKAVIADESVYTAEFSSNTAKGTAKVKLVAAAGQGSNVTASSIAQDAFVITDKSFEGVGANIQLSKSEVDFKKDASEMEDVTFQLKSSEGPIPYSTNEPKADENGFVAGTGTVTVTVADVYKSGDEYYTTAAPVTYAGDVTTADVKSFAADETDTAVYSDGAVKGTITKNDDSEVAGYMIGSGDTAVYHSGARTAPAVSEKITLGEGDDEFEGEAYDGDIEKGTLTVTFEDADLFQKGDSFYTATDAAAIDDAYEGITGTVAVDDFAAAEYEYTEASNFKVKILDKDGKDVTEKFGAENIDEGDAPYTTVTLAKAGLNAVGAGDYTVVAYTGNNKTYAGRATATLKVNPIKLDSTTATLIFVPYDGNGKKYAFTDEWKITYDPTYAKKVAGMTLEDKGGEIEIHGGPAYDKDAADPKANDVKVSYENNFAAGTAKVIIEGQGNYEGKIEKDFTIERADLKEAGFRIDFVTTSTFKKVKASDNDTVHYVGSYYTDYTGADITPDYEVNHYAWVSDGEDGYVRSDKPDSMLDDEFTVQWVNNKNVAYGYNSTLLDNAATLKVTATGNYVGSVEQYFFIDPIDLYNNPDVVVEDIADMPESAEKVIPNIVVKLNGNQLVQGTDYIVTSENDGKAGTYTAYVASANQGNVTVSTPIAKQFNIKKADEVTYDLTGATVELDKASFTYNGQIQAPKVTKVTLKNGVVLAADQFKATVPTDSTNAGDYKVTIAGAAANVTGAAEATYTIAKANNPLKIAKAKRVVKGVKKAKKTVAGVAVKKAGEGNVTFKKVKVLKGKKAAPKKVAKKITVNKKTGKIVVKKGMKKGTYKVTVQVKASGNANYNASAAQKAIVTLKVKK